MSNMQTRARVNGRFAKGGVVDMVSKGIESVAKAVGTSNGKAIAAADKAIAPNSNVTKPSMAGRIDTAVDREERGYALGGKVNRHGFEPKAAMTGSPLAVQPNGGEDTVPAATAKIPPAAVYPTTPAAPTPKFRGTPMKRVGGTPSLPYPKRR